MDPGLGPPGTAVPAVSLPGAGEPPDQEDRLLHPRISPHPARPEQEGRLVGPDEYRYFLDPSPDQLSPKLNPIHEPALIYFINLLDAA